MIKRTNPDNKNKKELAIELLKIKEKHISKLKSNIENVKNIKSKLIDLKIEISKKDGFFHQAKLRVKAAFLADDLIENGLNYEYLKKLHDESIKDLKKIESKNERMRKSNELFIKNLLDESNRYLIKSEKEIKDWYKKGKTFFKNTINAL